MPIYVDDFSNNKRQEDPEELRNADYDYDYPSGIDLKPGTDQHDFIKSQILEMANISKGSMSERYSTWRKIDKNLTTYTDPNEEMEAKNDKSKSEPVIVPVSYATLETLLTHMSSAFLNNPIIRYEGTGPEDRFGTTLLNMVVNKHISQNKVALNLHTMFRDSLVYGFGVVTPVWKKEEVNVTSSYEEGFWSRTFGKWVSQGKRKKSITRTKEGNALENIDPYMYLPDPNFPIHEPQKARFQGWTRRTTRQELLSKERYKDDRYNAKYLRHISGGSQFHSKHRSGRDKKTGLKDGFQKDKKDVIDVITMYVDLIPKDWNLGDSEYPEKWIFEVAGDDVILSARKLDLNHNKFPICVAAPDYDGYSISPVSKVETIQGMQDEIDWLIRSHLANVKKSINNTMVVDPSLINVNDLKNGEPGGIIRTRRSIWGRGVGDAIEQLKTEDITKGHLTDVGYFSDVIDKAVGIGQNLKGQVAQTGERVSATEARGVMQHGMSRLGRAAKITSLQALHDIAFFFAHHTQELMSNKTYVSITGEWEETLRKEFGLSGKRTQVNPMDLLVDFDLRIGDGNIPDSSDADVWVQLYKVIANNKRLQQKFDMPRIFKHIARKMGADNINDFIRNEQQQQQRKVMDNEAVQREVQKGNLTQEPSNVRRSIKGE